MIQKILAEDIVSLRKRHGITQKRLAESLYDIKYARIPDWESGRRSCPPIIFWGMVLTWDKIDIYGMSMDEVREMFKR